MWNAERPKGKVDNFLRRSVWLFDTNQLELTLLLMPGQIVKSELGCVLICLDARKIVLHGIPCLVSLQIRNENRAGRKTNTA